MRPQATVLIFENAHNFPWFPVALWLFCLYLITTITEATVGFLFVSKIENDWEEVGGERLNHQYNNNFSCYHLHNEITAIREQKENDDNNLLFAVK